MKNPLRGFLCPPGRQPGFPWSEVLVSEDQFPLSRLSRLTITLHSLFHKGSFSLHFSRETNAVSALSDSFTYFISCCCCCRCCCCCYCFNVQFLQLSSLNKMENIPTKLCFFLKCRDLYSYRNFGGRMAFDPYVFPLRGNIKIVLIHLAEALANLNEHLRSIRFCLWRCRNMAEKHLPFLSLNAFFSPS